MNKMFKKALSVILSVMLVVSCISMTIPNAAAEDTAATAGQYYVKVVVNVTNKCQGWTTSSITFTYKTDNGTSTDMTSDANTSTSDDIWNTSGDHVIFEGLFDGFPTGYTHMYNFGGGLTWRTLGYSLKIYAGSSSSDLQEVISQDFSASSSAFSAAKGTFTAKVDSSKYPLPTSCAFASGTTTKITIPRVDETAANIEYNAVVKDQYGVAWYSAPIYSLEEAHDGVSFANNVMAVTQEANSSDGADQTIVVNAALRTASAKVTVTLTNASYTYTFLDASGTAYSTGKIKYGTQIPTPTNPSKAYDTHYHYTFASWSTEPGIITRDIKFTPKFTQAAHVFTNYVSDGNATCLNDGTKTAVCNGCSCKNTIADDGSALGHNYVGAITIQPTCTEAGEMTYTCSRGDASYTETIPALGHDMSDWVVTTQPTCTEAGERTKTCSRCDYKETESIDALGHDMSDWVITTQPTCTADGEQTRSCSRGDKVETQSVPALGHLFGEWTITKAPTCTATGIRTCVCSRCKEKITQDIPALGHTFSDWVTTTAPTCTENGSETRTCSVCGEVETRSIPALGHDYVLQTVAPTDGKTGLLYYVCKNCSDYFECKIVDNEKQVGAQGASLDDIKDTTTVIPATQFNTYNRTQSNYNYVNRCAALRLNDGSSANIQAMRFTSSMLIPTGAELTDFGYVYTQIDMFTSLKNFIIGGANIENISMLGGHYSDFETAQGTVRTFNLVINITQPNWATDYVARPYITYTYAGDTFTVYDSCYSQRSVLGLAKAIIASSTESSATKAFFQSKIVDVSE